MGAARCTVALVRGREKPHGDQGAGEHGREDEEVPVMSWLTRKGAVDKPGFVDGKHYTTYVGEFEQLKRNGDLDGAEALLLRLVDATEAEAKAEGEGWGVAPAYYEHLAIVYKKKKDLAGEIEILERYERQAKAPGASPSKLAERLARLRAKIDEG